MYATFAFSELEHKKNCKMTQPLSEYIPGNDMLWNIKIYMCLATYVS